MPKSQSLRSQITRKAMNDIKTKIKLIFIPYLIISFAVIIGWTLLDWLLFIKLNVYPVNDSVRTFIIPIILSVISFFIWLLKRLSLLRLDVMSKKERDDIVYLFVSTFTI